MRAISNVHTAPIGPWTAGSSSLA